MKEITYNEEIARQTKYDGYYATKSGKIITIKVKGGQGSVDYDNPREHNYKIDKDGYLEVCLSVILDGKHKRIYRRVHRLIWETFNGDILNDLTIDHIDVNPQNNNLSNLQLLTRELNTSKATTGFTPWQKGKPHTQRNIYEVYVLDAFQGKFDKKEIMDKFGLTRYDFEGYPSRKMKNKNITLRRV